MARREVLSVFVLLSLVGLSLAKYRENDERYCDEIFENLDTKIIMRTKEDEIGKYRKLQCDKGLVSNVFKLFRFKFRCAFLDSHGDYFLRVEEGRKSGLYARNITCEEKKRCNAEPPEKAEHMQREVIGQLYQWPMGSPRYYTGDTFRYTCKYGYEKVASLTPVSNNDTYDTYAAYDYDGDEEEDIETAQDIRCHGNGEWSGSVVGFCKAITCEAGRFENITNGNITNYKDVFGYGESMKLKCDRGFKPVGGRLSAPCYTSTSFDYMSLSHFGCQEILCTEPSKLRYGDVSTAGEGQIGDVIEFSCRSGFTLVGQRNWTCQPNGEWDADCVICNHKASYCPMPCIPRDVALLKAPRRALQGSSIEFECRRGERRTTIRTCMRNRQWSDAPLDCSGSAVYDPYVGYAIKTAMGNIPQRPDDADGDDYPDGVEPQGRSINAGNQYGVDVYLLVDVSNSISNETFKVGQEFVKALLPKLQISAEDYGTRLALVYFASKAETVFNQHYLRKINLFKNATEAQKVIDLQTLTKIREKTLTGTDISKTLDYVVDDIIHKQVFTSSASRISQQVVILISDGSYTQNGDPEKIAELLKGPNYGVELYSIFVGDTIKNRYGLSVMQRMASETTEPVLGQHFFAISNGTLADVIGQMVSSQTDIGCGTTYPHLTKINDRNTSLYETTAEKNAWPWMAHFFKENSGTCGGSVIGDRWILTAAHCFVDKGKGTCMTDVQLNTLQTEKSNEALNFQLDAPCKENMNYNKNKIILHEKYDSVNDPKFQYDIALVRVDKRIPFDNEVRKVCLWDPKVAGYDEVLKTNNYGVVAGWGKTCKGCLPPDKMKQMQMKIQPDAACTAKLSDDQAAGFKNDTMFCAGDTIPLANGSLLHVDTCHGDSGGPFVVQNPTQENTYAQIGIVSFGFGCKEPGKYGIYTKLVPELLNWIKDTRTRIEKRDRRKLK